MSAAFEKPLIRPADAPAPEGWFCEVCSSTEGFHAGDIPEEAMCARCGAPYNTTSAPPVLLLWLVWRDAMKAFWLETGVYMGLAKTYVDRPECVEGRARIDEWLVANPDRAPGGSKVHPQ